MNSFRDYVNRRVTQQDIAKALNLDKSTVSLALRNNPGIAKATKEKVQAKADELGYRPDPALSTLARQRWAGHETGSGSALAYLIDSRMENAEQHKNFYESAKRRADKRGYFLQEFDIGEYNSISAISRVLMHRGIRGLLVPQFAHTTGPSIFDLPAENFTVVCLDLGWVSVPFNIVASDRFEATKLAWTTVVERGYRRVGGAILCHTPSAIDDFARHAASMAAQQKLLRKSEHIPLLTSDHRERDAFLRWLDRYEPEAIVGFISRVHEWILHSGRRVPEDIAFASLSVNLDESPDHSGVLKQVDHIGATAVDALIAAMNKHEWGIPEIQQKLLLEPLWQEGSTLPFKK